MPIFQGPGKFILRADDDDDGRRPINAMIKHAFDGMPFLHRFQLSSSTQMVRYNSRHLATNAEQRICEGSATAFFGHVSPSTSTWKLFKSFLGRFNTFVVQSNLVALKNTGVDPTSEMVGVTVTPNYPLPKALQSSSSDPVLVTKTDANVLQKVNADSLGKTTFMQSGFKKS